MNENNYSHALLKAMTKVITFILANCLGIAFFLQSHFSRFTQIFRIFGIAIERKYFQSFRIFGYNISSLSEANGTFMVWCIQNIDTAYLLDKFGQV